MAAERTTNEHCTVVTEIAARLLCIGCGACTAVCPAHRLKMTWSEKGTIEVCDGGPACVEGCRRCLKVCPFADGNDNEDVLGRDLFGNELGINHRPETGYYLNCLAGHSTEGQQRSRGASGGLATWFLGELLRTGRVDRVACVAPQCGPRPLFNYVMADTAEGLEAASGSAYYPVTMADVLSEIRANDARYAVTCLPCFAKALRLLCREVPLFRKRICAVAGLTCGHTARAHFAEYVAALAGVTGADTLERVRFRGKDAVRPASDFRMDCFVKGAESPASVYWTEGPDEAWAGWWFAPNPCLYCDDVFAECADAAFMDAWLREFSRDPLGTNLAVVRSELARDVMQAGRSSGGAAVKDIGVGAVILSQLAVVANKRGGMAHRLWLAERRGERVPVKRVEPQRARSLVDRWNGEKHAAASREGADRWLRRQSIEQFRAEMRRLVRGSLPSYYVRRGLKILRRVLREVRER